MFGLGGTIETWDGETYTCQPADLPSQINAAEFERISRIANGDPKVIVGVIRQALDIAS